MSDILKPTGNDGDFVHNNQTMSQDHSCVSQLWYDKTISIEQGINSLLEFQEEREDITCELKSMRLGINDDNKIIMRHLDGREFKPTFHALSQACNWFDQTSISYVKRVTNDVYKPNGELNYKRDRQDAETLLQVLNNGYRRVDKNKMFLFRTYSDGTLRAMLSDSYSMIDNVWYLETVQSLLGGNARLSHWRTQDADTIYGNILIPDTVRKEDDSDYGGMISSGNCEIGKRRLSQYPSVFRAICMNGCIWDQKKGNILSQVHRGEIDLNKLRLQIKENLDTQIPLMGDAIDRFMATRTFKVQKGDNAIAMFALVGKDQGLSRGEKGQLTNVVNQFKDHESQKGLTLFSLINSITRASQDYSNKGWVDGDMAAGKMMNWGENEWNRFRGNANSMSKENINKVFGYKIAG